MPRRARHRRSSSGTSFVSHSSAITIGSSSRGAPSTPPRPPPPPPGLAGSYDAHLRRLNNRSGRSFLHRGSSPARAASCGEPPERMATSLTFQPVLRRTGTEGCNSGGGGGGSGVHGGPFWHNNQRIDYRCPPQSFDQPPPAPPQCPHLQELQELKGLISAGDRSRIAKAALSEPEPPHMDQDEQHAWDAARAAGVVDHGCLLVWVVATADASADEWNHDGGSGGGSTATTGGLGSAPRGAARHDGVGVVPWEYLQDGLMEHLSGKLTVPSSQRRIAADEIPYGCIGDRDRDAAGGEEADDDEEDEEEGGWYGALDSKQERVLDGRELEFVRGILKNKQDSLGPHNRTVSGAAGRGRQDGGINADMVSVEGFAAFSLWWAPLMRTLSLVRRDWEATDPTRVHGFIRRFRADQELKRRKPGTFLLRFSERELGALVVSFREHVSFCFLTGGSFCL